MKKSPAVSLRKAVAPAESTTDLSTSSIETTSDAPSEAGKTRRHRPIHIVQTPKGWSIHVEGGGSQPFQGHYFTRWETARRFMNAWIEEKK